MNAYIINFRFTKKYVKQISSPTTPILNMNNYIYININTHSKIIIIPIITSQYHDFTNNKKQNEKETNNRMSTCSYEGEAGEGLRVKLWSII
jgi:hypothetical protein